MFASEHGGRLTIDVLRAYGLGQGEARRLQSDWRVRGWAENDPQQGNGLYMTAKLTDLLTNLQTLQTPTNPLQTLQTGLQPLQTEERPA
jgi:hypothetical protein